MPYRPIAQDEIAAFADLPGRAFRFNAAVMEERLTSGDYRYTAEHCRVWEDEERGLVAGLVSFERTVSLNGGTLPASLIATVSVPPDQRRRGYANALMRGSLEEDRAQRRPLSLLFPYSIPFYNRLGYGVVSYIWLLEFPLDQLVDFDELRHTRRMAPEDLPAMQRLYKRERERHNGWISRTEWEWRERVLDEAGRAEWPHRTEGVVVPGEGGELLGYLTYTLANVENSRHRALTVQEWVSDSERDEAWRALAGFVAAQRAQADFVRYSAPHGFPLLHALRERSTFRDSRQTEFAFRDTLMMGAGLMGRIVHLEQALRQRRYPEGVTGECVVQLRDPLLPANEAPLHLYIEGGRAAVAPAQHSRRGVAPTATADVRTWSELYAATLSPRDARRLGRLEADDRTVAFLAAALACAPWFIHRADWF